MLDLSYGMWYNATTSGRFFFFEKSTNHSGSARCGIVLCGQLLYVVFRYRIGSAHIEGGVYFYDFCGVQKF